MGGRFRCLETAFGLGRRRSPRDQLISVLTDSGLSARAQQVSCIRQCLFHGGHASVRFSMARVVEDGPDQRVRKGLWLDIAFSAHSRTHGVRNTHQAQCMIFYQFLIEIVFGRSD